MTIGKMSFSIVVLTSMTLTMSFKRRHVVLPSVILLNVVAPGVWAWSRIRIPVIDHKSASAFAKMSQKSRWGVENVHSARNDYSNTHEHS